MAIDLPPAMPPVLTAVQQVSPFSSITVPFVRKIENYEIHLTGEHQLSLLELDTIFAKAKTPSQAILLVNAATYSKGHLLVKVLYSSPLNGVIYVHALQTTVGSIQGDEMVRGHFGDLAGDVNLTREEFKTRELLAGIHSDRAGVDYKVSYQSSPNDASRVDLVFNPTPDEEHDATDFIAQLGNQGSRFAGRYFLDLGFKHDFSGGTQISGGYETAITEWGESREGEDYHQVQLKLDRPFSFGLYGIEASHTEYIRDLGLINIPATVCVVPTNIGGLPLPCIPTQGTVAADVELDASIDQFAITGSQVLSSDIDHRFTLSQRLDWTDSLIDSNVGSTVQDERYATLELGASYHKAQKLGDNLLNWKIGGALKGGVSGDKGTLGTDEVSTGVAVGKRTSEFVAFKPKAQVNYALSKASSLNLAFSGQLSDEQLPQQQQWVLGGVDRISAYLPGVLVGDTGYHLDVSYKHLWELGALTITGAVFAEYGSAQYENASGTLGTTDLGSDASIADAGIRATAALGEWLEVRAVIAESLSDDNIDEQTLERSEADFFVVVKAIF